MAIISIPTSIGGVSIPGGALNGPLGALFGKKMGSDMLQYPSDLMSNPTKAHAVQIVIREVEAINYAEKTQKVVNQGIVENTVQASLKPPISNIKTIINLYMPDTLNMTYNADYQDFSITDALGVGGQILQTGLDAVEKAKGSGFLETMKNLATGPALAQVAGALADKKAGTQGARDVLLRAGGQALNPQVQLLYKGISLRSFQLEFLFTPKSKGEAQSIKKIIDTLTYHFSPKLTGVAGGSQGQFFIMPSVFNVSFKFSGGGGAVSSIMNSILGNLGVVGSAIAPLLPGSGGADNENIFKVGDCVLENMIVDYAPNGWAAYSDGAPVQTRLTLQFKETDIIHRDRLKKKEVR